MDDDLIDVRILGVPVPLHIEAAAHINGLQRELELIRVAGEDAPDLPHRLRSLIDELTDQYGGVGDQPRAELDAASDRGDPTVDLVYRIPRSAGVASHRLGELLDQVDDHCRGQGHLLTLVTPPDALAYRRWFLGEFTRQCRGDAPRPWSEHRADRGDHVDRVEVPTEAPVVQPPVPLGWSVESTGPGATIAVAGPLDLVSAPALRNLLLVTASAADATTIDLAACDFIDSVGVSVLVSALLRADADGTTLRFRLGDAARRVLTISGVIDRLELVDDGP